MIAIRTRTLRIELTIEGFAERVTEWDKKLKKFIKNIDSVLLKADFQKIVKKAVAEQQDLDIIQYLQDQEKELPKKFKPENPPELFPKWKDLVNLLLRNNVRMEEISKKSEELIALYSGKGAKYPFFEFMKKVAFNDEGIVDSIQNQLIESRKELLEIQQQFSIFSDHLVKLINLDYERALLIQEMEDNGEEIVY